MLTIKNGNVIDLISGNIEKRDIYVQAGYISGDSINSEGRIIDATGLYVAPGLVDIHVHFRDPGYEYKEDIISGARAAAAGGFTTVACMANTKPIIDSPELVSYIKEKSKKTDINVFPIAAVTEGQKGERLTDFTGLKVAGACALSDDGVPITNAQLMLEALKTAKELDLIIIAHSEDANMTDGKPINEGDISRKLKLTGRPAVAEEFMIARDAMLAEYADAGVHIAHVSTAKSVDIIRQSKKRSTNITSETCPQYFTFTEDDVLSKGPLAKMFPPLRTLADKDGIIAGIIDGTIDIIATDHAPHSKEEKEIGLKDAPGGMVGLETSLAACLTALYHTGKLTLVDIIRKMSINPASRLKLPMGGVRHGDKADLVIFNADREWSVDTGKFYSKSRNTPFGGMTLKGRVEYTICGGKVIFKAED